MSGITPQIRAELARAVGSDRLTSQPEDLLVSSYDATPQAALPGVGALPDVVIYPERTLHVQRVLRLAHEHRIPVYPRGAGTGLTGGAVPVAGGIVLDLSRMNRIISIDTENLVAVVESGVVVSDFQQEAESRGLFYPPDPASAEYSTMGGNVAECAGGLRGLKYGVTRDYVLALETVLATGEVIHTGRGTLKSVTGYDVTKLLIGSEGTLGVFTEITVKLIPLPEALETFLLFFPRVEAAGRCVSRIIAGRILPRALEFMDRTTFECVRAYRSKGAPEPTCAGDDALRQAQGRASPSNPEAGQSLPPGGSAESRGWPGSFPTEAGAVLLVELDGAGEAIAREREAVVEVARGLGAFEVLAARDDREREWMWEFRRVVSPALLSRSPGRINEDICIPRSRIPEMLDYLEALSREFSLPVANFGHAGDGNIHVNILVDAGDPTHLERAERMVERVFRRTVEMGGTLSGEHGIGLTKRRFLSLEVGSTEMELMRALKRLFDPRGILNPGKIFPAEPTVETDAVPQEEPAR